MKNVEGKGGGVLVEGGKGRKRRRGEGKEGKGVKRPKYHFDQIVKFLGLLYLRPFSY